MTGFDVSGQKRAEAPKEGGEILKDTMLQNATSCVRLVLQNATVIYLSLMSVRSLILFPRIRKPLQLLEMPCKINPLQINLTMMKKKLDIENKVCIMLSNWLGKGRTGSDTADNRISAGSAGSRQTKEKAT